MAPPQPIANKPRDHRVVTTDGVDLIATVHEPSGPAVGTAVIFGGTAIPARFYRAFAEYLASGGVRAVRFDYRGIGRSRPRRLRGFRASMTEWGTRDATAVWEFSRRRFEGPVACVGHSFGAQLLGLSDQFQRTTAVVTVAGQMGYFGHWPAPARYRLALLWHVAVPTLTTAFGYLPGWAGLGVDLPAGAARQWAAWCSHPAYLLSEHPEAAQTFAALRRPTVLFSFTDDSYAPEPAVEHLRALLPRDGVQHHRIAPEQLGLGRIGHFGYFREGALPLWQATRRYLLDALAGDPAPTLVPRWSERPLPADPFSGGIDITDVLADLSYGRS